MLMSSTGTRDGAALVTQNLPNDADSDYFLRELKDTTPGKRFYRAWMAMKIHRLEILRTKIAIRRGELDSNAGAKLIADNQRSYIRHSTAADEALDELSKVYNWPTDSTADKTFQWKPRPREHWRQSRR